MPTFRFRMHRFRALAAISILLGASLLTSCGGGGGSAAKSSRVPHQLRKSDLSVAEQKYGIAPIPDSTVTYKPDVIVVGGGADAIREQSSNGFIWTIDAGAPRASELAVGKVMFLTNRAVGRVLDVRRQGANLVVVLGPVDITELVSEAHIHIKAMPVDFSQALAYTSADMPGKVVASVPAAPPAGAIPAVFLPVGAPGAPGAPAPAPTPDVSKLVNFKVTPYADETGVGLRVASDGGGLKVAAQAVVYLATPTLNVNLDITPGEGLTQASVELLGAAGLVWKFDIGTDVGLRANVNGLLQPDTDFSIPVGGLGPVPLAITVRQRFLIKTALGVRNSTLSATGDYKFKGGFKVGYFDGKWDIAGPVGFSTNQSMLQSASGISIAASGVDMGHQVKVIAGIGVHGFAAGPYFSFNSSFGLFKGSDMGMIACKEATIVLKLSGGVGYLIPKSITDLINSVLSALNISFRITGEGGLSPSEAMTIVNSTSTLKGCKAGDKA